jgi:opacity protein-like surface antigen
MNDDVGWGFGFGYHVNDRFMVGFESTWIEAHYDATIAIDLDGDGTPGPSANLGGRLDAGSFLSVGPFNVLPEGRFTPFVQGKLGWTYTDSNIPAGPAEGVCWWDPWWGYVCDAWQPTFSSWSFSYGGGVGLRAQVGPQFFIEGSYNLLWIDLDQGNPSFDGFRLNFGWVY